MIANGGYLGSTPTVSAATAQGIWSLNDAYRYQKANSWPFVVPPMDVTSGLIQWLKADAGALDSTGALITTDNTAVATLQDQSSAGNNATQSTSGSRPAWRNAANGQNGIPVITFNGSSQFLTSNTSLVGLSSFTVIWIAKSNTSAGWQSIVRQQASTGGYAAFPWTSGGSVSARIILDFDGGATSYNLVGLTNSQFNIMVFRRISGTSNTARVNRTQSSTRSANTSSLSSTAKINIGNYAVGEYFNGTFCESLIYNRDLSDAEITTIESYAARWGI